MKKTALFSGLLALALCGFSSPASADCCAYDPCEWSSCDGKFTFGADWLYWKTEQSNMNIASIIDTAGTTTSEIIVDAKNLHANPKFNNGFRVCAGYALPCNGWDLNVSYYNLPTHAKRSTTIDSDTQAIVLNPFDFPLEAFTAVQLSSLGLKWDSNLQNIDVDIARTITFGECFKLRPHVGFRTTWMDQKYRFAGILVPPITDAIGTEFVAGKVKEKFNGYGVEGGLWATWEIGAGFSLVGHVGGSLLYTKFRIHDDAILASFAPDGTETTLAAIHVSNSLFLGTPSLDYFLGLEYTSCFCDTELSAHVGWEQHAFFDVNQLARASGNLYTQGLTLGVAVAF